MSAAKDADKLEARHVLSNVQADGGATEAALAERLTGFIDGPTIYLYGSDQAESYCTATPTVNGRMVTLHSRIFAGPSFPVIRSCIILTSREIEKLRDLLNALP